ncbi:MAG: GNAT family N-acetyltransferase [Kangiellaceae bacterium]|nr:GNAT family N-acetyltransferase [Kangiellaceae bacterium]
MTQVKVRAARIDDLATLLRFEQSIIEWERPMCSDMKEGRFNYYNLKNMIQSDDVHVVVAEENGTIIAAGHAKLKKSRDYLAHEYHSYLGFMYVEPEYRGQGLNKVIIDELKNWSKNKGMTVCSLTVYDQNQSAIRAYQKIGFKNEIIEMRIAL